MEEVKILYVNLQEGLILTSTNSIVGAFSRSTNRVVIREMYKNYTFVLPDPINKFPREIVGHISLTYWDLDKFTELPL